MGIKPATRLVKHLPSLHGWSSFHGEWKVDFNSYALQTTEGVVLVDPVQPSPAVQDALEKLGEFSGIYLTNANHHRAADWFRKQYQLQVYAHEKARPDCETTIDVPVLDGEKLPGGLRVIYIPGSGAGEIALHTNIDGGILLLGDALLHSPGEGLAMLPDQYCDDPAQARESLRKLPDLVFDAVTFAHGAPIVGGAQAQIAAFIQKTLKK